MTCLASIDVGIGENRIIHGDCLKVMRAWPDNCIDSIVTDPPYGLKFMGKEWDHGVPGEPFWREMLRIAKPGAILLAFGGTRTHHRLVCAIEDAGWQIRDTIMWIYGSGFPKSLDISKAIDKAAGAERVGGERKWRGGQRRAGIMGQNLGTQSRIICDIAATDAAKPWNGYGTALKPAHEPICVAMKPLDGTFAENAQKWGVAGLWIDGGRIDCCDKAGGGAGSINYDPAWKARATQNPNTKSKLIRGEYQDNGQAKGRWPANIIHDGSEEVVGLFPQQAGKSGMTQHGSGTNSVYGKFGKRSEASFRTGGIADTGSAARFFYCAKASKKERRGSKHPTVKPLALMEYLCKLCRTPTGGIVLDPFCGSGTTCEAARNVGRKYIGIDSNPDSVADTHRRLGLWDTGDTQC